MEQHDYINKIFDAFPNAYINRTNEVIISEKGNVFFSLSDVDSNDGLCHKILSWCSRDACKSLPYNSKRLNENHHAFIRQGCNKILGRELSEDDWWVIYERLGNNVNPQLAKRFIESDFDMSVLEED